MEAIEEVDHLRYLGSLVDTQGGNEAVVKARIGKARVAFLKLKNILDSNILSMHHKMRIFNTNVKAVLLYAAETWRTTVTTTKSIQTFVNSCLIRIVGVCWPEITSNDSAIWKQTSKKLDTAGDS